MDSLGNPRTVGVALAAAGLVAGAALSEFRHKQEHKARPVRDEHHLAYEVFECQESAVASSNKPPTLVFLHGWPDDVALFRPFAKALCARYRCINCNLPNYPLPESFDGVKDNMPERAWGFTLQETAIALENTIKKTCGNAKSVTLVTHDWGAVIGYLLHIRNPADSLINRMVSLDVGWWGDGMPFLGAAGILGYQTFLNLFYLLPSSLGTPLTDLEQRLLCRVPAPGASAPTSVMNWPYRAAWRDILGNGPLSKLNTYTPTKIPIFFIYGNVLPRFLRFCDDAWLERVRQSCPGVSKTVEMKGYHWFVNTNTQETIKIIDQWLLTSEEATSTYNADANDSSFRRSCNL